MKNTKKKGFTIVELVIVIAVIAILAAVAIPTFTTVIDKANQSNALQMAKAELDNKLAEKAVDGEVPQNGTVTVTYKEKTYTFNYVSGSLTAAAGDPAAATGAANSVTVSFTD